MYKRQPGRSHRYGWRVHAVGGTDGGRERGGTPAEKEEAQERKEFGYKYHEAYHLLKFTNEKQILEKAYSEYIELKKSNLWGSKKYF